MARAAKLDLRAFQQELATRLAAKTSAQVEQSRLGLACAGAQWLIRLADAGEVIAVPTVATRADDATVVSRHREHSRQSIRMHRFRRVSGPRRRARRRRARAPPGWCCSGRASANCAPGLVVHRVLGLRNLAELRQADAPAGAPAWYGSRWTDAAGRTLAGNRPGATGAGSGLSAGWAVDRRDDEEPTNVRVATRFGGGKTWRLA